MLNSPPPKDLAAIRRVCSKAFGGGRCSTRHHRRPCCRRGVWQPGGGGRQRCGRVGGWRSLHAAPAQCVRSLSREPSEVHHRRLSQLPRPCHPGGGRAIRGCSGRCGSGASRCKRVQLGLVAPARMHLGLVAPARMHLGLVAPARMHLGLVATARQPVHDQCRRREQCQRVEAHRAGGQCRWTASARYDASARAAGRWPIERRIGLELMGPIRRDVAGAGAHYRHRPAAVGQVCMLSMQAQVGSGAA